MELNETFVPLALEDLVDTAREYKEQGYQLAQMMGVLKEDDTVWLYYTFIKGNEVINRRIEGIIKGAAKAAKEKAAKEAEAASAPSAPAEELPQEQAEDPANASDATPSEASANTNEEGE